MNLGESGKNRLCLIVRRLEPADHHCDFARLGLASGAADRCVEHHGAFLCQGGAVAIFLFERQRAGLKHDKAFLGAGGEAGLALHHFVEHRGGRHRGNHDVGFAGDFGVAFRHHAAGGFELARPPRAGVIAGDREAVFQQIGGKSAPHDTQTAHADTQRHNRSPRYYFYVGGSIATPVSGAYTWRKSWISCNSRSL